MSLYDMNVSFPTTVPRPTLITPLIHEIQNELKFIGSNKFGVLAVAKKGPPRTFLNKSVVESVYV